MMMDFDDITPRDVMNTRVTLYRRGQNPSIDKGVTMDICPNETILSFLKHAAERLGVADIDKVVNMDGDEIDDVVLLNQDDVLYALVRGEDLTSSRRSDHDILVDALASNSSVREDQASPGGRGATARRSAKRHSGDSDGESGGEGSMVGSYELGRFLGSGSFGKVHVGTHNMTGERVALKFMDKAAMGTFQDAERVFTEVQCLNSLDHPNVIKLLHVINLPDHMVLALEFASGGDLKEIVDDYGAVPEDLASRIFVQILDGVTYCHRHNIVHYDLKLENILLVRDGDHASPAGETSGTSIASRSDSDPPNSARSTASSVRVASHGGLGTMRVKIADFGLSQFAKPGQTSEYAAGSLAYIAPEVFHGGETAGPPRDVWAMGVILFAIVCGRLPFTGSTYNEVSGNIRRGKYSFLDNESVSESCQQLIAGMLRTNPEERMAVSELRLMEWIDRDLPHTRAKTPPRMAKAATQVSGRPAPLATDRSHKDSHSAAPGSHQNGSQSPGEHSSPKYQARRPSNTSQTSSPKSPSAHHRHVTLDEVSSPSTRLRTRQSEHHLPGASPSGRRTTSTRTVEIPRPGSSNGSDHSNSSGTFLPPISSPDGHNHSRSPKSPLSPKRRSSPTSFSKIGK